MQTGDTIVPTRDKKEDKSIKWHRKDKKRQNKQKGQKFQKLVTATNAVNTPQPMETGNGDTITVPSEYRTTKS